MDKFALLFISVTIMPAAISNASSSLDGFQVNNISSTASRYKRGCPNLRGCEEPVQLPRIPARTNCVLPELPDDGNWTIFDGPRKHPGEIVPAKTILQFQCHPQFKLLPEIEFSICYRRWSVVPNCLKTCPSLRSTRIMHVGCEIDNKETSCIDPYDGSTARITCVSSKFDRYLKCSNGSWDAPLPVCIPESVDLSTCTGSMCKFQFPDINDEAITTAVFGEFPFMAAISYKPKSGPSAFLCSGALISKNYVIFPAHCANMRDYGAPESVRLGSLNPNTNESATQDIKVKEVKVHPDYKLPSSYNNIALIKLEKPITAKSHVQPISIIESETVDVRGIVVGWIRQENDDDNYKGYLKRTTMATITADDCNKIYPANNIKRENGVDDKTQLCKKWTHQSSAAYTSSPTGIFITENKEESCKYSLVSFPSFGQGRSKPEIDQKVYPYTEWINSITETCECKN